VNPVRCVIICTMETPSQGLMKCSSCGLVKAVAEMTAAARAGTKGTSVRCKICENAYVREWRKRNPEAHKAYYTEWRAKNRAKLSEQAKARRKKLSPTELNALRKHEAEKTKRLNADLKDAAYIAYGGYVCACCGESERGFLSIDHINNDGNKLRKTHGHGADFYRWLKANNYPAGFQILCMNCNYGKHHNSGVCPHQTRCNDYPEREYSQVAGSAAPLQ
jgi:hypothetical protein